jgi:hypothetical protein
MCDCKTTGDTQKLGPTDSLRKLLLNTKSYISDLLNNRDIQGGDPKITGTDLLRMRAF